MKEMKQTIQDQTKRSLWSLENTIRCIPGSHWEQKYSGMPLWKHVYHTLHSLDRWYVNPFQYEEPSFHKAGFNDLDLETPGYLSPCQMLEYLSAIQKKLDAYIQSLTPEALLETPPECPYSRFHLIMAQHRHLDMHVGMLMGFLIADGKGWPKIMGIDTDLSDPPQGDFL